MVVIKREPKDPYVLERNSLEEVFVPYRLQTLSSEDAGGRVVVKTEPVSSYVEEEEEKIIKTDVLGFDTFQGTGEGIIVKVELLSPSPEEGEKIKTVEEETSDMSDERAIWNHESCQKPSTSGNPEIPNKPTRKLKQLHYLQCVDEENSSNSENESVYQPLDDTLSGESDSAAHEFQEEETYCNKPSTDKDMSHYVEVSSTSFSRKRKRWNRRHCCLYCEKVVLKIARHLQTFHSSEPLVIKALAEPKKSTKRNAIFEEIRKKGDHAHNSSVLSKGVGQLLVYKRPQMGTLDVEDFIPCPDCAGYFAKRSLWRHRKKCTVKLEKGNKRDSSCEEAGKTLLPSRRWNRQHCCLYCEKIVLKIARHLQTFHSSEPLVIKALAEPKKSAKRNAIFEEIRKKGDHVHNSSVLSKGVGQLLVYKRPQMGTLDVEDFIPCPDCAGYFAKRSLWRHRKNCTVRREKGNKSDSPCKKSENTLLPSKASCNSKLPKDFGWHEGR